MKGIPFIINRGKLIIEDGVRINSTYRANPIGGNGFCSFVVQTGAHLRICRDARISNVAIVCWTAITIGEGAYLGGDVRIYDTDFHALDADQRTATSNEPVSTGCVRIGARAFVGASAIVLKGVTIGEGSVVGAGSVVARDVPAGQVWAGNPARFLRDVRTKA